MGLERKGMQFRIRVRSPSKFSKLRTIDPGEKGGLQLIVGRLKGRKVTSTQSIRLSTKDFKRIKDRLIPKTMRGMKERASLKRRKTGLLAKAIKRYF